VVETYAYHWTARRGAAGQLLLAGAASIRNTFPDNPEIPTEDRPALIAYASALHTGLDLPEVLRGRVPQVSGGRFLVPLPRVAVDGVALSFEYDIATFAAGGGFTLERSSQTGTWQQSPSVGANSGALRLSLDG